MALSYHSNLTEARSLNHKANVHLSSSSHSLAFPLYLKAAELYSLVVRQVQDPSEKKKIRTEFAEVLRVADAVKKVLKSKEGEGGVRVQGGKGRCDPDSQALNLLQSSTISTPSSKLTFPGWKDPLASEFTGSTSYSDPNQPPLPSSLSASYALPPSLPPSTPIWSPHLRPELVEQDAIGDCSFVAGVQAALGWSSSSPSSSRPSLLSQTLHPQLNSSPTSSPNGLHLLRLFINGTWRRVPIDAALPVSSASGESIGMRVDAGKRKEEEGLGLRLLEKGWLKVMGGWEFPGSNSSIDLHAMTGWIPETIGIKSADFQREKTWSRLFDAFLAGHCLLTIGTGKLSASEVSLTGLISRHDYAVQELREIDGRRELKILNPWRRARREAHDRQESRTSSELSAGNGESGFDGGNWTKELRDSLSGIGEDGSFILSWETVCATFDAIYLNWDPSLFKEIKSVHSDWKAPSTTASSSSSSPSSTSISSHAQIIFHPTSTNEIWLLLTRHFTQAGAWSTNSTKEFISLQTFEEGVARVGGASGKGGTFTDSPHVLLRIKPTSPTSPITIVLSRDGPPIESRFSLFGYSSLSPFTFSDVPPPLPFRLNIKNEFLGRSAGGSARHPTFLNNPSFRLEIKPPPTTNASSSTSRATAELKVMLETEKSDVPVGVMVLWAKGERVATVIQGDILADSGLYNDSVALAGKKGVAPGIYTLVLSTFEPKQETPFTLSVESTLPLDLKPIPQEGAGMFSRTIKGVWSKRTSFGSPTFKSYHLNPTYKITLSQPCEIFLRLSLLPSASNPSHPPPPLPLNLTIFHPPPSPTSKSPLGAEVLTTGPYDDAVCGVVTPRKRLEKGRYLVVVSTYGPWAGGGEGVAWGVTGWSEGGRVEWEKVR
ncbi:hypothetical protein BDY24DRAFT_374743 [Mrakia frigida]|uniref:Rim13p n=1 Tax=Mrakia frigida TaxID=29902 RepID=UPI003FCC0BC3